MTGPQTQIEARCIAIADAVVPNYRNGKRAYSCTSQVARMWQAAYDGAAATIGGGGENTHPAATGSVREALRAIEQHINDFAGCDDSPSGDEVESDARKGLTLIRQHLAAAPTPDAAASEAGEVDPGDIALRAYNQGYRDGCEDSGGEPDMELARDGWHDWLHDCADLKTDAPAALTTQGGAEG